MMTETLDFLKLFGGFVYLLMGGDLLVRGALGLARESKIPPMIVGLTVVAMGTSAPELMVSTMSALSGFPGIAVGNVVGSNVANVLLVLGVPVLIHPIVCDQEGLGKQASLMVAVSVLFLLMCAFGSITFFGGVLLVFLLVVFLILATRGTALLPIEDAEEELERVLGLPSYKSSIILFIVLGAVMLPLGADLVVDGAAGLAAGWGVSEAVIGLSLIALGTSLPELSTTVIAALHKSSDVAIGNVIGSNMFNILAILGITALLTEIPVDPMFFRFDLWVMFACTVMLWLFVLTKTTIRKPAGVLFLAGYLGYMYTLY
ncbi:calcium/sodium antiporter [Pseudomonadales bacterium]|nr:calcium/sodium antiporter [Pseudomonadales bacterium]MDB2542702.1 calcium/sodium antiporter [Pseudomonadales bacterium]MDC0995135.1 calcium/sodium antiporter [Pseudomonadales bacterium]MDG1002550.1 calcium/sodium antiporter [Pseudomonadales bacterium]MDG1304209.1 calcium/sodium antiporter [Pseudomonadales bacterium]|tara:strand:- start:95 stop:1045 length:951 start_codon:yes stop_codon:yes gene_type:complete